MLSNVPWISIGDVKLRASNKYRDVICLDLENRIATHWLGFRCTSFKQIAAVYRSNKQINLFTVFTWHKNMNVFSSCSWTFSDLNKKTKQKTMEDEHRILNIEFICCYFEYMEKVLYLFLFTSRLQRESEWKQSINPFHPRFSHFKWKFLFAFVHIFRIKSLGCELRIWCMRTQRILFIVFIHFQGLHSNDKGCTLKQ